MPEESNPTQQAHAFLNGIRQRVNDDPTFNELNFYNEHFPTLPEAVKIRVLQIQQSTRRARAEEARKFVQPLPADTTIGQLTRFDATLAEVKANPVQVLEKLEATITERVPNGGTLVKSLPYGTTDAILKGTVALSMPSHPQGKPSVVLTFPDVQPYSGRIEFGINQFWLTLNDPRIISSLPRNSTATFNELDTEKLALLIHQAKLLLATGN